MPSIARSPVLAISLLIGLVIGGSALVAGGSPLRALVGAAIPIAYGIVVTLVARRSDTASVLAGRPVDERWQMFNLEASAWALGVSAVVVIAAVVIAQASGGDYLPYAFIGAVMGLAYIGSLIVLRLRD